MRWTWTTSKMTLFLICQGQLEEVAFLCRISGQVMNGFDKFPGVPGKTGRDRKQLFCYVGDVAGLDLQTADFNKEQLETTSSVNVPSSLDLILQLLGRNPIQPRLGPIAWGMPTFIHSRAHAVPCIPPTNTWH
jgi:hypothetical protein